VFVVDSFVSSGRKVYQHSLQLELDGQLLRYDQVAGHRGWLNCFDHSRTDLHVTAARPALYAIPTLGYSRSYSS